MYGVKRGEKLEIILKSYLSLSNRAEKIAEKLTTERGVNAELYENDSLEWILVPSFQFAYKIIVRTFVFLRFKIFLLLFRTLEKRKIWLFFLYRLKNFAMPYRRSRCKILYQS